MPFAPLADTMLMWICVAPLKSVSCVVFIYVVLNMVCPAEAVPVGQHCILQCASCRQRRWSDCSRDNPRFCLEDFGRYSSAWKRAGKDLGIGGLNHISDRDGNGRRYMQVIVTPQVGSVILPVGSLVLHQKCHGQHKPSSGLLNSLVVQICSKALMDQLYTGRLYAWSAIICLHVLILDLCNYYLTSVLPLVILYCPSETLEDRDESLARWTWVKNNRERVNT